MTTSNNHEKTKHTALARSESQSWTLSSSLSLTTFRSTGKIAISSNTGFRSPLMILVENNGLPSWENVKVT